MVNVCAVAPTTAVDGDKLVMAGTGLFDEDGEEEELPPPQELKPTARMAMIAEQIKLVLN